MPTTHGLHPGGLQVSSPAAGNKRPRPDPTEEELGRQDEEEASVSEAEEDEEFDTQLQAMLDGAGKSVGSAQQGTTHKDALGALFVPIVAPNCQCKKLMPYISDCHSGQWTVRQTPASGSQCKKTMPYIYIRNTYTP